MFEGSGQQDNAPDDNETEVQTTACCLVCAIATVDSRGQIVLPKELRDKAGIKAGDKLAVINCQSDENVCCIALVRADDFTTTVKGMLGPMMKDILK
jgi:AbrB family looped-hinge helix DNA binding protein